MTSSTNRVVYWGTGRRKTAVARVRVKAGNGEFMVNERPMEEFFDAPLFKIFSNSEIVS